MKHIASKYLVSLQLLTLIVDKTDQSLYTVYIYISVAVDCGSVVDLINGQVNSLNGTTIGSVATFTCNFGYKLSHQQVVMCGGNGMWSPASPTCQSTSKY